MDRFDVEALQRGRLSLGIIKALCGDEMRRERRLFLLAGSRGASRV